MSGIDAITLVVDDPSAVARQLGEAFGWKVTADYELFAEVSAGDGLSLWLNVPSETTPLVQQGVVLHYTVDDVAAAANRARAAGADILREPTKMDFGLESALAQIEGGLIVDLTRPISK